jgi:hypothetical protein
LAGTGEIWFPLFFRFSSKLTLRRISMSTGPVSSAQNLGGAPVATQPSTQAAAAIAAAQARMAAAASQVSAPTTAGNTAASQSGEKSQTVITSDSLVTSSLDAVKNGKTFYHRVAGARTNLPDGREIRFLGGMFITDDPEIISELNKVCDRPASGIFSRPVGVVNMQAAENQLAREAGDTAGTGAV